jgi:hypothetical protein
VQKQGTDLLDVIRLTLDDTARTAALTQLGACDPSTAADIAPSRRSAARPPP